MRSVPWWALLSSAAAPVLLIGGWQLGAARQPPGFDPVTQTISALAAYGATDRWIMTAGLAGLGGCHLVTAFGLRPAALPGRLLLAIGGAATVLVAVFPQPEGGSSPAHILAAGVAFAALSLWPALAWRRSGRAPLRPAVSIGAAVVLLGLLGWFATELYGDGVLIGLSERALAGSQALWPLAVVLLARR
ncbi:MAG: DUF998 domain-containing protein [Actinomycetota bacterium]|nr:DUF998 domain-containing protein [Actinomycetota bacterium]